MPCPIWLAQLFDQLIVLATFAAMQRIWLDCNPDLDPMLDQRVQEQHKALLAECPEIASTWEGAGRRGRREPTRRERRLTREIARLDRIRQALHDSERRFKQVVRNAPFPVMIYTEDGRVRMINRRWSQLCGWDKASIPTVQKWIELAELDRSEWSPEDLQALDGWDEVIEEGESRIRTRTGQIRHWEFSTTSLGRLPDGRRAVMRTAEDVSERRELETSLWETNRKLVNILESITDAFCALDAKGRFQYINTHAEQMIGRTREELIGQEPQTATPELFTADVLQHLRRCVETQQTQQLEYYINARQMHVEMSIYGSKEGVTIYFRDISQRKQTDADLRASERRFRGLFASDMLGIMFAHRISGEVLDCNDALLKIIGYSRADLESGRVNWKTLTPPEYAPLDAQASIAVADAPLVPYKKDYIHKLGHWVPILIGGAPVSPGDDQVMAFVIDRTAERDAELSREQTRRMLEEVIRITPVAIAILDQHGLIRLWNPEAERLFGWSEQELLGKPNPAIPAEWRQEYEDRLRQFIEGRNLSESSPTVLDKSGRKISVRVQGVPFRDDVGKVVGIISIIRRVE